MPDIYSHELHKFAQAGLQLRVPVDLVPTNEYSRLTNATPIIEGRLEARGALNWLVSVANTTSPGSGLHSLSRINQPVNYVGDRVAGIDTNLVTYILPAGVVPTTQSTALTGDPLTLPAFHFNNDTAAWQIVGNRATMLKYRSGLTVNLGITTPQDLPTGGTNNGAATASDGGAGNLNNGSGPGYDWVYTYVNTKTLTETNPSIANFGANTENKSSTAFTSPDPGFGGVAADVTGVASGTLTGNSSAEKRESILWKTWAAASQQYQQVQLMINFSAVFGGTTGCCYAAIYFSLDNGATWRLFWDSNVNTPFAANYAIIANLPANQDITLIQVRAVTFGIGNTTTPQNVIARRIRDRGGNFNVTDLLTGGGGNRTVTLTVGTPIVTQGVFLGAAVTTLALANRKANVCVVAPSLYDTQVDAIRLYRRGGSVTASWAFVGQFTVANLAAGGCGANRLQIVDNVADANLANFVNFGNDAPINSIFIQQRPIPYIWGPGLNPARLFGCGDPDRSDAVYFSNPGNADQWGVGQWVDTSSPTDPMQNGCIYNTRVFAFSKERMFELTPSLVGGSTITPFQTPCTRGLISPWGLLSTARLVYFVSKDGIYSTDGGPEQSLIENNIKPLFPTLDNPNGRSVEDCDAVNMERIEDIRLKFHNDEIYFIYRGLNTGLLQCLIYDQQKNRWRRTAFPVAISNFYSEEGTVSSLLAGDTTGSLYQFQSGTGDMLQASTQPISVNIRTGAYDQGQPLNNKEYGSVLFDIDPGGATVGSPVTITPLLNGEAITQAAITITGSGRQQVPLALGDVFGFNIEFDITFTRSSTINPVLYQFDILWRLEPAAVTHWEARETSHGLPGWQHLRDIYLPIRSQQQLTLTCTFDGGGVAPYVQTYTLPSTGGLRQKLYLPLNSNKFKLVRYSLDQTVTDITKPFRIYVQDLEVRVKPWLTNLGYTVIKPFGAEAAQVSEAFESQVLGGR